MKQFSYKENLFLLSEYQGFGSVFFSKCILALNILKKFREVYTFTMKNHEFFQTFSIGSRGHCNVTAVTVVTLSEISRIFRRRTLTSKILKKFKVIYSKYIYFYKFFQNFSSRFGLGKIKERKTCF